MNCDAQRKVSFSFQPIVDLQQHRVFAYEALMRMPDGGSAGPLLKSLEGPALHTFDRDARVAAVTLAASLGLDTGLSLNLLPQSITTTPDTLESTLRAARTARLRPEQLILEVTEGEIIHDPIAFSAQINEWRTEGVRLAIDDFGAGYSGLNLLAEFQPDLVKLDMNLVRDVDAKGPRQAIVRAVLQACVDLGIEVIAEGVESMQEFTWFRRHGVVLYQGYLFCPPVFESLRNPDLSRFVTSSPRPVQRRES